MVTSHTKVQAAKTSGSLVNELEQAASELRLKHLKPSDITVDRLMAASGRSWQIVKEYITERVNAGEYEAFQAMGDNGRTVTAYRAIQPR